MYAIRSYYERTSDSSVKMIKVIDSALARIPSFNHAVQVWRSLQHPHILHLVAYETEPIPFLVTIPPEGVLQKGRIRYSISDLSLPVPKRAAVKMMLGLCRGLSYVHHLV